MQMIQQIMIVNLRNQSWL